MIFLKNHYLSLLIMSHCLITILMYINYKFHVCACQTGFFFLLQSHKHFKVCGFFFLQTFSPSLLLYFVYIYSNECTNFQRIKRKRYEKEERKMEKRKTRYKNKYDGYNKKKRNQKKLFRFEFSHATRSSALYAFVNVLLVFVYFINPMLKR